MWLRIGIALALGVALGVLASSIVRMPEGGSPGHPPALVPGIEDRDRAAAMLSVHANARELQLAKAILPPLNPDSGVGAIDILRLDQGPAAASRKRRAVAKLGAYGAFVDGRGIGIEFAAEIAELGVSPAFIAAEILARFGLGLPTKQLIEEFLLGILGFMTPQCNWSKATGAVGTRPPNIEWRFEVEVPRRMQDVARAFDPQSWKQCSALFEFGALLDAGGACCPSDGDGSDCPTDATPVITQPRGRDYGSTPLFEEFCYDTQGDCGNCATANCEIDFQNILCVETDYDIPTWFHWMTKWADRYDVTYVFGRWLHTEFNGDEDDEITEDSGEIWVERSSGPAGSFAAADWTKVHVEKRFRFYDPSITAVVRETLLAYQDELAGQVVEQACCTVALESWP